MDPTKKPNKEKARHEYAYAPKAFYIILHPHEAGGAYGIPYGGRHYGRAGDGYPNRGHHHHGHGHGQHEPFQKEWQSAPPPQTKPSDHGRVHVRVQGKKDYDDHSYKPRAYGAQAPPDKKKPAPHDKERGAGAQGATGHHGRKGFCPCMMLKMAQLMEMIQFMQAMHASYKEAAPEQRKRYPKQLQTVLEREEDITECLTMLAENPTMESNPEKYERTMAKVGTLTSVLEGVTTQLEREGSGIFSLKESGQHKSSKMADDQEAGNIRALIEATKQTAGFLTAVADGTEIQVIEDEDDINNEKASHLEEIANKYSGQVLPASKKRPVKGDQDFSSNGHLPENSTLNSKAIHLGNAESESKIFSNINNAESLKMSTKSGNNNLSQAEEIQQLKQENAALKEKNKEIQQLYEMIESSKSTMSGETKSKVAYEKEIKQKDELIRQLRAECEKMAKRNEDPSGAGASPGPINTPSKVATNYEDMRGQEWSQLNKEIDKALKNVNEVEKLQFMCNILMQAEEVAQTHFKKVSGEIYKKLKKGANKPKMSTNLLTTITTLTQDAKSINVKSSSPLNKEEEIPEELLQALENGFQMAANDYDVTGIAEEIFQAVKLSEFIPEENFESDKPNSLVEKLRNYVKACARIAWKMAIQRPPMKFDDTTGLKTAWTGENNEYNSAPVEKKASKPIVECYIHPTLKHNEQVMSKGTVLVTNGKE